MSLVDGVSSSGYNISFKAIHFGVDHLQYGAHVDGNSQGIFVAKYCIVWVGVLCSNDPWLSPRQTNPA